MGPRANSLRLPFPLPAGEEACLSALAVDALLDEARLAPKPGLVDSRGNGAHSDLNLDLMCRSANALTPAFASMAAAGIAVKAPTAALRERLGQLGRDAEATMMATTGGVNTHRGAIWAMGLLVAAAAIDHQVTSAAQAADELVDVARELDDRLADFRLAAASAAPAGTGRGAPIVPLRGRAAA